MKLYIKQKVFSWTDKFYIKDEFGNDRYYAQGELFSWGRKLHVFDNSGREIAFIHQKLWTWFQQRYFIELNGRTYNLVKEFTFMFPKFHVEGLPWRMEGDFFAHEYSISQNQQLIMKMSKHWLTWGDFYELDIMNPANELMCLCIALGIDCMNADADNAST